MSFQAFRGSIMIHRGLFKGQIGKNSLFYLIYDAYIITFVAFEVTEEKNLSKNTNFSPTFQENTFSCEKKETKEKIFTNLMLSLSYSRIITAVIWQTRHTHTHTKLPTNFSYFFVDSFKLLALNYFMYTNKYLAYNMCTKRKANRVMTRWSLFPLLAFVFVCSGFCFAMCALFCMDYEAEISVKSGSGKKE